MLDPGLAQDVAAFCRKYVALDGGADVMPDGYCRWKAGSTEKRSAAKTTDMPSKEEATEDVEAFIAACLDKTAMALEDPSLFVWIEYVDRHQSKTNARAWLKLNDTISRASGGALHAGTSIEQAAALSLHETNLMLRDMVRMQHGQVSGLFDNIGDLMMRTATAEARLAVEDDDQGMMGQAIAHFAAALPGLVQVIGAHMGTPTPPPQDAPTDDAAQEEHDDDRTEEQREADTRLARARGDLARLGQLYQSHPETLTPHHVAALVELRDALLQYFPTG